MPDVLEATESAPLTETAAPESTSSPREVMNAEIDAAWSRASTEANGTDAPPDPSSTVAPRLDAKAPPATITDPAVSAEAVAEALAEFELELENGEKYSVPGVKWDKAGKFETDPTGLKRMTALARNGRMREVERSLVPGLHMEIKGLKGQNEKLMREGEESLAALTEFFSPTLSEDVALDRFRTIRQNFPEWQAQQNQRRIEQLQQELVAARQAPAQTVAAPDVPHLHGKAATSIHQAVAGMVGRADFPWLDVDIRDKLVASLTDEQVLNQVIRLRTPEEVAQGFAPGYDFDPALVAPFWDRVVEPYALMYQKIEAERAKVLPLKGVANTNQRILANATPAAASKPVVTAPRPAVSPSALTPAEKRRLAREEMDRAIMDGVNQL